MVRGLYTAYTGMINEQKRLDIISNNIANSATVGYKKENVTNQAFDEVLTIKIRDSSEAYVNKPIGNMSLGVKIGEVYTDYGQGSSRQTSNTYDMAIEGQGFFKIRTVDKNGNDTIRYTRNGCFRTDIEGHIVDEEGNNLQGDGGDLQVPVDAKDIVIDTSGYLYADGQLIDTISLADFENYDYLKKYGDNMYTAVEGAEEKKPLAMIHQGSTEQSNINTVSEMIQMITISRAYEANQKVIQTIDGMIDRSVNQVGKV